VISQNYNINIAKTNVESTTAVATTSAAVGRKRLLRWDHWLTGFRISTTISLGFRINGSKWFLLGLRTAAAIAINSAIRLQPKRLWWPPASRLSDWTKKFWSGLLP
jgi:thiosulfate reductase cytochrome b subunit